LLGKTKDLKNELLVGTLVTLNYHYHIKKDNYFYQKI